jgi:hypothetical protein
VHVAPVEVQHIEHQEERSEYRDEELAHHAKEHLQASVGCPLRVTDRWRAMMTSNGSTRETKQRAERREGGER